MLIIPKEECMLQEMNEKEMNTVVGGETQICLDIGIVKACVDKEDVVEALYWIRDVTESPMFAY
jgi:bacteriocin-like protein